MKHIIAINGSPRSGLSTDILVREAAAGAASEGAETEVVDLYRLDKFTGCVSCFGCKTLEHLGECICQDGLTDVLEKIRRTDGIILESPVYLDDISVGLRALFERLLFQYITYKTESSSYNKRKIPVVLILTSNVPAEHDTGLLTRYKDFLEGFIGPTQTMASGNMLQVSDYERYNWAVFNPKEKKARYKNIFPKERQMAFSLGADMVR